MFINEFFKFKSKNGLLVKINFDNFWHQLLMSVHDKIDVQEEAKIS